MNDNIRISFDIDDLNWSEVSLLYKAAFGHLLPADKMERIFTSSYVVCTARDGERCCGAVYAISDGVLDATIHGLAVHPEYQGQGIATRMMEAILEKLAGISILLTTDPDHIDYYRRMGFKKHKATMALRFPEDEVD
jgi:ribosomal protein S18 acetylase RimI-like enzyme